MREYPREIYLLDNTRITVRPIESNDLEALYIFFSKLPKSDLLIYKDDFTSMESLENWFASSVFSKTFQLVALSKGEIVANGSIHPEGLFWSHAAELKLIVAPDFRCKGLGSILFNILLYEVIKNRFEKIIFRYVSNNISFTKILNQYGFKPDTKLICYVNDKSTNSTIDLIIASFSFENWDRRYEFYSFLYR